MSCFECKNHHEMSPVNLFCPICGEMVAYMDGASRNELRRQEEFEREEENREEEE